VARAITPLFHGQPARPGLMLGFTGFPARAMDGGVARLSAVLEAEESGGALLGEKR
jgi:GntR family transcriptional regulator/MocR family aminotransferase